MSDGAKVCLVVGALIFLKLIVMLGMLTVLLSKSDEKDRKLDAIKYMECNKIYNDTTFCKIYLGLDYE
jgi:hypothetical protein